MPIHLRRTPIILFILLTLAVSCNAINIVPGNRGRYTRASAVAIASAIRELIWRATQTSWYQTGVSYSRPLLVTVENVSVRVRIWVFAPIIEGMCDAAPSFVTMPLQEIRYGLNELLEAVWEDIVRFGYDRFGAYSGNFGVEYHRDYGNADDDRPEAHRNLTLVGQKEFMQEGDDCQIFRTSLLSGTQYSILHPSEYLVSINQKYRLVMQEDCNLVLYSDNAAEWASGSYHKGTGCYLRLHSNADLTIYDEDHKVVAYIYISSCKCDQSSSFVVQNDRNLVLYLTDGTSKAAWASGTMS